MPETPKPERQARPARLMIVALVALGLLARLALEMQRRGLGLSTQSNKLSAKELQSRTRMER